MDQNSFEMQVLRVIGSLYASHPVPLDLDTRQTHVDEESGAPGAAEVVASSGGTLQWLSRNGYVLGHFNAGGGGGIIFSAQLPGRVYAMLQSVDRNLGGKVYEYVLQAMKPEATRADVVASRLLQLLTG